jgi:hypothetical protein
MGCKLHRNLASNKCTTKCGQGGELAGLVHDTFHIIRSIVVEVDDSPSPNRG